MVFSYSPLLTTNSRAQKLLRFSEQIAGLDLQSTSGIGSSSSATLEHPSEPSSKFTTNINQEYAWETYDETWWERGMPGNLKDCSICVEEKPLGFFPLQSPTTSCQHEPEACLDCIQTHIRTQIATGMVGEKSIKCPECSEALSLDEIQKYADTETFQL